MSLREESVDCERHGASHATFLGGGGRGRREGLTGVLDSEPSTAKRPRRGDRLEFGPEHVVQIERSVPEGVLRELGVR